LLLVAACGEAGCAPAPLVVWTGAGNTATGDTAISAASTPESQRAASGLEFGEFTTLIYSLYADFARERRWESLPLPFYAPLWEQGRSCKRAAAAVSLTEITASPQTTAQDCLPR
jgi:hypothetical protein